MALIMSISEVVVISSIKPFFESFSSINLLQLEQNEINSINSIIKNAYYFIVVVLICGILRVSVVFTQYRLAGSISAKISTITFKNIINKNYLELKSANQSNYLSILIQDIPRIHDSISSFANLVSNSILVSCLILTLLILETKIFIISIIFIGLTYLLLVNYFGEKLRRSGDLITKFNHSEASLIRASLASIVNLIISDSLNKQLKKYKSIEKNLRLNMANSLIYSQSPRYIVETVCFSLFAIFVIIAVSNQSNINVLAKAGTLAFAFNRALPAAQQIYSAYAYIKSCNASLHKVVLILEQNRKAKNIINTDLLNNKQINIYNSVGLEKNKNYIKISNLGYQYNDKDRLINYPNFTFQQNHPTAITGPSGSGKSTLIELILGLIKPTTGKIIFNQENIKNINIKEYYSNISYLSQSPFLFSGSIYENIQFGSNNDTLDRNELIEIGTKLGLKKEFGSDFLDYMISDFGRNISGGQAQRCSLLRILYQIKPILILDEPCSSLDSFTADLFNDLLFEKAKNSILITITHSKIQSERFDSILIL